jgi:DNA-binding CsgD family transcriptional regulator
LANIRLVRGRAFDDLCERFPSAPAGSSMEESAIDRAVGLRLVCRGETDAARGLFSRLRALAEERGEAESAGTMHLELCDLELRAGNVKAARSLMEEAEDWFAFDAGQRDRAAREAITAAIAGLPSETERWAAEMIRNARATGTFVLEMEGRRVLGVAALCAHDVVRAVEELRPIWAHMVREGIEEVGVWPMAPDLVEALIELGEVDEARVVTRRLRRLAKEQDHPWGLASADRCEAMIRLALGDYDERAAAQLDHAASAYGAIGMRFDEARSLLALGRAARRSRRWAAARGALERAADVFDELGADGWAEQARTELERVGARRPSPAGALTPSEDRVARLAAEGLSNKEIATRLFITAHTVEKHLSHAYAKLGVTSRAQLAHLFAASA